MFKFLKKSKPHVSKLYNKILFLSRNKLFYTKLGLKDTFQNRINLIFLHISFLFIKLRHEKNDQYYVSFSQKMFDFIFKEIELNMREIGYGDITVNKNMKFLIKSFYNILLNCENYKKKKFKDKNSFLLSYLSLNNKKKSNINDLVEYFDKYRLFCLDLTSDRVLKGELNFIYK